MSSQSNRKFGFLKDVGVSTLSSVEKIFGSSRLKEQVKENVLLKTGAVKDQLDSASCVGQAVAGAQECFLLNSKQLQIEFNPWFVYWNARRAHMKVIKDHGTYIDKAFESVAELGICEENDFKPLSYNSRPPFSAYHSAYDFKNARPYKVLTFEGAKVALSNGFPIVAGWNIDQRFLENQGEYVDDFKVGIGGHAMFIFGYQNHGEHWLIQNSWGKDWGSYGQVVVSKKVFMQSMSRWVMC